MFHVEKMEVSDLHFAVQLANTMNWNMTPEDFKFMMHLEPRGCFVQFQGDKPVGIATSIAFCKVGWFGDFIVKEDVRGEGAGSLLVQTAIEYLRSMGAETIGLYAYPHSVKFYRRFGFETDIDFSVMTGKAALPANQKKVKVAEKQDIPELIDLDSICFGASRKKLLENILLNKANLCYVSADNNELTGFVAAKVYGKMAEVGPLICPANHVDEATLLLRAILSSLAGFDVFIYVPKKEIALLDVLNKVGLKEEFSVVRMFLGLASAKNCMYAAESLERG
jgi:hypothetical protein